MTPRRILIVNPFGIGDVLFSTPLIRAVHHAFPHAYLAYLGNRRTEEILRRNTNLDELFIYEKDEVVALWDRHKLHALRLLASLFRQIRHRRFDVAIDLSLGERYSFLLALFGVPRRIGFDFRRRGRFLSHRFAVNGFRDRHVVEYYAELLGMLGIHQRDAALELAVSEDDRQDAQQRLGARGIRAGQRLIALVPAGGVSWGLQAHFRRWSKDGFIQVGRALSRQPDTVLLIFGEPQDHAVCAQIAQAIGAQAVDLSGQTTLGQFISLIARCALVITNDGGPVHIAASQGVRTVSIFGPVEPEVYGPYPRTDGHRVVYREDLPCRPCYHQFKLPPCPYERACLATIGADDVLEACEAALAGGRA
ncbi:MAG: glycosyltransferase family 9 protein [Candidatus Omnitrophica bacterium]|nr:glycosyltransferase family 9 protein [Candidatus Omnitrophota bacterium]